MLRFLYQGLLRLHPTRFRQQFADEMLWIFDQSEGTAAAVKLLGDGFFSLVRQWTLRSEYWEEKDAANTALTPDGVPLFHTLEPFKPRTGALLQGGMFSVVVFYVILLAMKYSWNHPVFVPFSGIQSETTSEGAPSSSRERSTIDTNGKKPAHLAISPGSRRVTTKAMPSPAGHSHVEAPDAESPSGARGSRPRSIENPASTSVSVFSPASPSPMTQSSRAPAIPSEILRAYAGRYVAGPQNEIQVLITVEDGKLAIEVPGESKNTLVAMSATRFAIAGSTNDWIDFKNEGYRIGSQANICLNGRHFVVHRKFY